MELPCDVCGQMSSIVEVIYLDSRGVKQFELPKVVVKSDGIYCTVKCLKCGDRDLRLEEQDC